MLTRASENCGPRSHRLPPPGSLVTVVGRELDPHAMAVVESYPLCEAAKWRNRYVSRGLGACVVRFLATGRRVKVSWQSLAEVGWCGFAAVEKVGYRGEVVRSEPGSYSSYSDIPQGQRVPLGHKAQRRIAAIKAQKDGIRQAA